MPNCSVAQAGRIYMTSICRGLKMYWAPFQIVYQPPTLRYTVGYYTFTVTLPNNNNGYTAAYQTCCRIDNIMNVGNSVGATYTCTMPGLNTLGVGVGDNSPRFSQEISIACFQRPFTMNFSATDPDGDQLVYSLCSAYNGGAAANSSNIVPGGPPYQPGSTPMDFQGQSLGPQAAINANGHHFRCGA